MSFHKLLQAGCGFVCLHAISGLHGPICRDCLLCSVFDSMQGRHQEPPSKTNSCIASFELVCNHKLRICQFMESVSTDCCKLVVDLCAFMQQGAFMDQLMESAQGKPNCWKLPVAFVCNHELSFFVPVHAIGFHRLMPAACGSISLSCRKVPSWTN